MTRKLLVRLFRTIEGETTEDIVLVAEKIIEEETKKGHNKLAGKLSNILRKNIASYSSFRGELKTLLPQGVFISKDKRYNIPLAIPVERKALNRNIQKRNGIIICTLIIQLFLINVANGQNIHTDTLSVGLKNKSLETAFKQIERYEVSGRVTDIDQRPVGYTTITITKAGSGKIMKSFITDSLGQFKCKLNASGTMIFTFSAVGKDTLYINVNLAAQHQINLNVTLGDKTTVLKEVVVASKRPTFNYTPGNIEVNVRNNQYFKGLNSLTVLKRLPGVVYNSATGAITLDGKAVQVYINDRPVKLSQEALISYLQSLPVGSLEKINLTSQPGAKYDADINGGIINFYTHQNPANTWNAEFSANYAQYRYGEENYGLVTDVSINRVYITANLNYTNGTGYSETTLRNQLLGNISGVSGDNQYNNTVYRYNPFNIDLSVQYQLDKKNRQIIQATYTGSISPTTTNTNFQTDVFSGNSLTNSTITKSLKKESAPISDFGINYKNKIDSTGKTFQILGDHSIIKYNFPADYNTSFFDQNNVNYRPDSLVTQQYNNRSNINSIKLDYTDPAFVLKTKLEIGAKASRASVDNSTLYFVNENGQYLSDPSRTNGSTFSENIYAAYLLLTKQIGKKLSIQFGGRVEETKSVGKEVSSMNAVNKFLDTTYLRFYPDFSVAFNMNEHNHLSFTINTKINRPQYQQYNPFVFYIDPYNVTEGNPYLLPAVTTNMELMYAYKDRFSVKLYYSDQSRQIVNGLYTSDTTLLNINKPVNLDYARYFGMTVSYQQDITKFWNVSASAQLGTAYKKGYINNILFNPTNPLEIFFSLNQSFKLSKTMTLDNSVFYRNKNFQGVYINDSFSFVNLSLKKSFFSDRFYIRAELDDIFNNSGQLKGSYITNQMINTIDSRFAGRQFVLNLTYSLKNRHINTNHENSSSDEIDRAKK